MCTIHSIWENLIHVIVIISILIVIIFCGSFLSIRLFCFYVQIHLGLMKAALIGQILKYLFFHLHWNSFRVEYQVSQEVGFGLLSACILLSLYVSRLNCVMSDATRTAIHDGAVRQPQEEMSDKGSKKKRKTRQNS